MACIVCDKIREKKALIAYEDDNLIAILPAKPAVPGHIKIMPKQHFTKLEELSDELVEGLFFLANFSSASVFEALQAHGTNIILNEGDNHLVIDVIPRKEGDNLNFSWKPKELSPEEMDEIHNRINDKAFVIGKEKKEEEAKPVPELKPFEEKKEEVIKIPKEDRINYLIKQLLRIP
ncbi:MAG TPA: HIT family protein [Candidatus Nanoarchaeia archaeon]|nr:HIT family protein [Candidatus Nanoarchaeia archaeon]